MATALITGVAGFVGSHVAEACLNKGLDIIGIDDLSGGYLHNVDRRVNFIEGSTLNVPLLQSVFKKYQPDYVFHFAAFPAENQSHYLRAYTYHTNTIGSANLINQAIIHKIKCFVFASSIAVYGESELPFNENQHPQPIDPYGISKYSTEMDLLAAEKMFGLNFISFRLHNVFGVRQNYLDNNRNAISIFMTQIVNKKPLTLYGDGMQTRQFTLIDDIAPIIASSVYQKRALNKFINLGADAHINLNLLAENVINVFGFDCQIIYLPKRHEVQQAFASHDSAKLIFGGYRQTPLLEGLMGMKNWIINDTLKNYVPTKSPPLEIA